MAEPKVFISYSWSNPLHRELVREWADRLTVDGVDVILDQYDLVEGQDKFAFMEKIVTDPSVTHVLVISDKTYTEKANDRKAGVGTESQIISSEIYNSVEQLKFVPIVAEFDENGDPYLPVFMKARIWINFSNQESVNENWERLIRHIYGKPLYQKPKKGKPPIYITEDIKVETPVFRISFQNLKTNILSNKPGIKLYREEFLANCINYADSLRASKQPEEHDVGKYVLENFEKHLPVRNALIDWIVLESNITPEPELCEEIIGMFERLIGIKGRPSGVSPWNDMWYEPNELFVYETFLYSIAALLKREKFSTVHEIFTTSYILPEHNRRAGHNFEMFDHFHAHSSALNSTLAPEGRHLYSPAAELLKRNADRQDLAFTSIIEADLVAFLASVVSVDRSWYPQTFHYQDFGRSPHIFMKATQHKHFVKLATVIGASTVDTLKNDVKNGFARLGVETWRDFSFARRSLWSALNVEGWDTIK